MITSVPACLDEPVRVRTCIHLLVFSLVWLAQIPEGAATDDAALAAALRSAASLSASSVAAAPSSPRATPAAAASGNETRPEAKR